MARLITNSPATTTFTDNTTPVSEIFQYFCRRKKIYLDTKTIDNLVTVGLAPTENTLITTITHHRSPTPAAAGSDTQGTDIAHMQSAQHGKNNSVLPLLSLNDKTYSCS